MRRLALTTTTALLALLFCAPRAEADEAVTEVPFTFEKGHVIVAAKIKGDIPVEVVLATGSEYSLVDSSLLEKYKLKSFYTGEPPITGTSLDRILIFSDVPDVRVGGLGATSVRMRLGATLGASQSVGRTIFGVLGYDFFKGRVVQFDFKKKVARFFKGAPAASGGPAVTLRMEERSDPFRPNVMPPVVEGVTFNGRKAGLLLHTGAQVVVGLSSSAAKRLGFAPPPEKGEPRDDKIDSLRFGTYEMTEVPVVISAKGTPLDQRLGEHGAVAGTALLQNFLVTFDFRNKSVTLAANQ